MWNKNGTEVTLNFSSNFIGNSNDETNFPHKLLLTDTQVSKSLKFFANGLSANIRLTKTQLSEKQSGVDNFRNRYFSGRYNYVIFHFKMEIHI